MHSKTTNEVDYKPFLIRNFQKAGNDGQGYYFNPMFLNSTSYGTQYANWGAKPFERVRAVDKRLLELKFKGSSSYNQHFMKSPS
jgi:hypothetical protein